MRNIFFHREYRRHSATILLQASAWGMSCILAPFKIKPSSPGSLNCFPTAPRINPQCSLNYLCSLPAPSRILGCSLISFFCLRTLASYEAKTAKISNFWTFWSVIQLINHLIVGWFISLIIGQNVQRLLIFAVFAL